MSEKSEIKRDGAKAQKNSGRGKMQKGDALWNGFCVDYKEYSKSFSINKDNWGKICNDAWASGNLDPCLKLILGTGYSRTRLAVIEWSRLEELVEAERRCREFEADEERRIKELMESYKQSMKAFEEDQESRRREFG